MADLGFVTDRHRHTAGFTTRMSTRTVTTNPATEYTWAESLTSTESLEGGRAQTVRIPLLHNRNEAGDLVMPRGQAEVLLNMLRWALEHGDD